MLLLRNKRNWFDIGLLQTFQGEVKVGGDAQEERLRRIKSDFQGFLQLFMYSANLCQHITSRCLKARSWDIYLRS